MLLQKGPGGSGGPGRFTSSPDSAFRPPQPADHQPMGPGTFLGPQGWTRFPTRGGWQQQQQQQRPWMGPGMGLILASFDGILLNTNYFGGTSRTLGGKRVYLYN